MRRNTAVAKINQIVFDIPRRGNFMMLAARESTRKAR
jgi:hypothetical protein